MLKTIYLKNVPTNDELRLQFAEIADKQDVAVYKKPNHSEEWVRYPWHFKSKPTKRNKYLTLNCFKYLVKWVS